MVFTNQAQPDAPLNELQAFAAVAEAGSFRPAAARLDVTPLALRGLPAARHAKRATHRRNGWLTIPALPPLPLSHRLAPRCQPPLRPFPPPPTA